jgi:hypothetical protein
VLTDQIALPEAHPLAGRFTLATIVAHTYDRYFERGARLACSEPTIVISANERGFAALVQSAAGETAYTVRMDEGEDGGLIRSSCDCPISDKHRLVWCKHRVAVALQLSGLDASYMVLGAVERMSGNGALAPLAPALGTGRRFAEAIDPLDDLPLSWTYTSGEASTRHLRRATGRSRSPEDRALCGAGGLNPAHRDAELCRRCAASHKVSHRQAS